MQLQDTNLENWENSDFIILSCFQNIYKLFLLFHRQEFQKTVSDYKSHIVKHAYQRKFNMLQLCLIV